MFAGLALVLAAVGLYGVVSYSVTQRTHELGIRMALGADRRVVVGMILRQGFVLTLCGGVIGLWLRPSSRFVSFVPFVFNQR